MSILINHLGYQLRDSKLAVIQSPTLSRHGRVFLYNDQNECVKEFDLPQLIKIDNWKTGAAGVIDFSDFRTPGTYYFIWEDEKSHFFTIHKESTDPMLIQEILDFFHRQRCTGEIDCFDRTLPFFGQRRKGTVDVHGGWYDASGDVSKYLSHLSYTNFMGPQQIPLVIWGLLEASEKLPEPQKNQAEQEALFGADFLHRMCDAQGYFYQIVFDRWSKELKQRNICNYSTQQGFKSERWEASFRQGGGMAIAALARAATLNSQGEFTRQQYKDTAIRAFDHLQKHNIFYLDNREENIIDIYCSLMASSELYWLTKDGSYAEYSINRIKELLNQQHKEGWWFADKARSRPFFHASDEGLPLVALLQSAEILRDHQLWSILEPQVSKAVHRAVRYYLEMTSDTDNPFSYPRQTVKPQGEEIQRSFFFPHQNESGYWWQGENARLGSLYSAVKMAEQSGILNDGWIEKLTIYRSNLRNWLLGLNPFDACMMEGMGHNNPEYEKNYPGVKGGICNGITSSLYDEKDIALCETDDPMHSWRWGEQWIPHAAWWLIALS